ncbi:MAG: hypothetical protein JETT_2708 [Candidatus Jettenia ecosi]|uniref:Uncharacterized protein n=1 Tax=Candidatus Jettenia ecosi TaxID=2494326 RepID=A0A533QKD1_9BACT|nr:MAG: hypothetical protein JETT_2708 [Candidatus Jettenia ecosi]
MPATLNTSIVNTKKFIKIVVLQKLYGYIIPLDSPLEKGEMCTYL